MGQTADILDGVRGQVAPSDETLACARERRRAVIDAASAYPGFKRSYMSGSIAHGTANDDTDADCGAVLDRRSYTELGPDGDGVGPCGILESIRSHLRETLSDDHDDLALRITKRAIVVKFNDPIAEDVDPHVDLIVALSRKDASGLWIPNTETDDWDASDPETHTSMLTAGTRSTRALRARVVRLAKAWNNQYGQPGLCSFNLEALALAALEGETNVAEGVSALFSHAARDLRKRLTPDPAGVSKAIKVLIDRDLVVGRLDKASSHLAAALAAEAEDDEETILDELASVFWKYVDAPESSNPKAALAGRLRADSAVTFTGTLVAPKDGDKPLKSTRAYGGVNDA